jgi:hypothetical protein
LLLEGQLLVCVCNAEHNHLALGLGERGVPLVQRLLRRLTSDALLLQRRPGVGEGGLLLLEPPLSPLAGSALLQELLLSDGERRDLGVEGRPSSRRPPWPAAPARVPAPRPGAAAPTPLERRAEPPVLAADAGHLRLPVGRHRAHLLQV